MSQADIDATRAPLMEHLIELRSRLIKALLAFLVMFIVCFFFAKNIYNLLVLPYQHAAGPEAKRPCHRVRSPRPSPGSTPPPPVTTTGPRWT